MFIRSTKTNEVASSRAVSQILLIHWINLHKKYCFRFFISIDIEFSQYASLTPNLIFNIYTLVNIF